MTSTGEHHLWEENNVGGDMRQPEYDDIIIIPSEFICPITLQVMTHPLTTRDGHTFERSAIVDWMERGNSTCPLTRKPMEPSDLIRNRHLESRIGFWRKKHGMPEPQNYPRPVTLVGFLPDSLFGDRCRHSSTRNFAAARTRGSNSSSSSPIPAAVAFEHLQQTRRTTAQRSVRSNHRRLSHTEVLA